MPATQLIQLERSHPVTWFRKIDSHTGKVRLINQPDTLTDLLNFIYGVNGFFGGTAVVVNLALPSVRKSESGAGGRDMEILVMSVVEPLC